MTEIINRTPDTLAGNISAETLTTQAGIYEAITADLPIKPTAKTVNFRGKEVTLKYTLLSLQRLEEQGVSLQDLESMSENVSVTMLIKMVWAGLCLEFRDATLDEVAGAFDITEISQVSEALSYALNSVGK
ncbi:hypothetical protein [Enterococcus sp. AZ136]|uniref:hypothetical protein n=1 Tax=Enterococcus sp. AZ136 TaxID=2774788 RepID=UPI003D2852B3